MDFRLKRKLAPIMFIAPFLIVFLVFMVYPICYSVALSFMKYRAGVYQFNGLKNFKYLLTDSLFYTAILNTFIIAVIQVPIMIFLSILIGTLMNSALLKLKGMFRMLIFIPVLIDGVSYAILFGFFFSSINGYANNILGLFGVPIIHWLSDPLLARAVIVIMIVWKWTGYNSIIMLAGLQSISNDLYEAASIDGANAVVKFFKITIPELTPVIVFAVVLAVNGTLQLFTEPSIMTKGGPINSTLTIVLYLYNMGIVSFNYGVASAGAYILAFMIVILTIIQMKVTKED